MRTLVIYATKFGNTQKVAEAIARGAGVIGDVTIADVGTAGGPLAERPDLVIVGGPTQRRGPSPELRAFMETLPAGSLQGRLTASFDTRYRGSTLFMGSAARDAAKRIEKAGGRVSTPPESFFMQRGGALERQQLESGELERAEAWGRTVAAAAGELVAA